MEQYIRNAAAPSGFGGRCKPCHNAMSKDTYWVRQYGLTRGEVDELRWQQGNACAICADADPQHLDHDHVTGRVRRLLCQRCNQGLGLFRDDPYLLHVAALYVDGHRQEQARVTLQEAGSTEPGGDGLPGEPPVGSQPRPGAHGTTARTTGRTSGSRRRTTAGEADG